MNLYSLVTTSYRRPGSGRGHDHLPGHRTWVRTDLRGTRHSLRAGRDDRERGRDGGHREVAEPAPPAPRHQHGEDDGRDRERLADLPDVTRQSRCCGTCGKLSPPSSWRGPTAVTREACHVAKTRLRLTLQIVKRPDDLHTFKVLPRRWVVEGPWPGSPAIAAPSATTSAWPPPRNLRLLGHDHRHDPPPRPPADRRVSSQAGS